MLVQVKNAEEVLVQTLQKFYGRGSNENCLYMRASTLADQKRADIMEDISEWIGPGGGEVFYCSDGDAFILSPTLTDSFFEQVKKRLKIQFGYDETTLKKLVSFYNVQTSGLGLLALAKNHLTKKLEKSEKSEAKKRAEQKIAFINSSPRPDLQASISQRRNARTKTEILIIEDDAFTRRLINTAIGSEFSVSFAENGQSGLLEYIYKAPDIVFLDIGLPDVSGQDVLLKFLSLDSTAFVVMLSGNSQTENILATVKAGAKGFIAKPFNKDKIFQYIHKCPTAMGKMHHNIPGGA